MRVLNKGRLDSLGADLRIEKEIGKKKNYDNSKALHAIYMLLSAIGMWLKYK